MREPVKSVCENMTYLHSQISLIKLCERSLFGGRIKNM